MYLRALFLTASLGLLTACAQSEMSSGNSGREKSPSPTDTQQTPPTQSSFVGIWEVTAPSAEGNYLTIGPEGNAINSILGSSDMNGTWKMEDEQMVITWQDGSIDLLTLSGSDLECVSYAPHSDLKGEPLKRTKLSRIGKKAESSAKTTSWAEGVLKQHCRT